jgi:hypothetical protein
MKWWSMGSQEQDHGGPPIEGLLSEDDSRCQDFSGIFTLSRKPVKKADRNLIQFA